LAGIFCGCLILYQKSLFWKTAKYGLYPFPELEPETEKETGPEMETEPKRKRNQNRCRKETFSKSEPEPQLIVTVPHTGFFALPSLPAHLLFVASS
jgi:hypothetical protein